MKSVENLSQTFKRQLNRQTVLFKILLLDKGNHILEVIDIDMGTGGVHKVEAYPSVGFTILA